jgi:chromate reductase, NAD(P)H dehydrogenase (quinone)
MRIFLLAASLRKESSNKALISLCANYLGKNHEVDFAEFSEFDVPLYNGDIQEKDGIPQNAQNFSKRIKEADKVIFSVPEYNYSVPGAFKNLIDWASRIRPIPYKDLKILILTASTADCGGNRSYWHTKIPFEGCGAFVYPGTFSLAKTHKILDSKGELREEKLLQQLHSLLDEFTLH